MSSIISHQITSLPPELIQQILPQVSSSQLKEILKIGSPKHVMF